MSKYKYEAGGVIIDTELDMPYHTDDIVELLDEKDQRITELEKRLENSIVPKFKIGQEVFIVNTEYLYKQHYKVEQYKVVGVYDKIDRRGNHVRWYTLDYGNSKRYNFLERNVFATREEAEQRLKELQEER